MNISFNWLKDLIEIDLTPEETARKLTSVGLAVEGIHAFQDDFVFDIDLTSNRPDCLSHLGVSREIAVIQNSKFKIQNYEITENPNSEIPNPKSVTVESPEICHRFTARIIRNVKIAPSPDWLKNRLEAIGQRSINNVADITNFVMHELGNPMHSFDLNKLAENRIVVRQARQGETIKTLDEVERKLTEEMLVICDAEKPVAVAGIMGGFDSGISDETTDVLLEVAYFRRDSVRQTSRKLGLNSEASYRFERGVDIENLIRASNRATELICTLADGEAGEFIDLYPTRRVETILSLRPAKITTLTDLTVEPEEIKRILSALGFAFQGHFDKESGRELRLSFAAPSWRIDMEREEDLVEEIARHVGYDKIGEELPPAYGAGEYQPSEPSKKNLRKALTTQGFNEAISYSFINIDQDEKFEFIPNLIDETAEEKFVTLQDSIIEGAIRMRSTLLAGLLESVRHNLNFGNKDLKLFELGKVFAAPSPKSKVQSPKSEAENLPIEKELFSLILTGGEISEGKAMSLRELDFYDAKGALESAIESMNLPKLKFQANKIKHLREGQAAEIIFKGAKIGSIGRLSEELAQSYKFKQPVYVAEVDLQTLLASEKSKIVYKPLNKFPAVVRDVSLLVKRTVTFADLQETVLKQNVEFLQKVEFVDTYEGKGIADDERSITLRFEFRSASGTLREEIIEETTGSIVKNLENGFGVRQRF